MFDIHLQWKFDHLNTDLGGRKTPVHIAVIDKINVNAFEFSVYCMDKGGALETMDTFLKHFDCLHHVNSQY